MKTKAFSKEGLSATAKLDPKEKEKLDTVEFLTHMVDELDRQIETLEAEEESLQATVKKGKKDSGKADRLSEISRITERHKFHQGKLELLLRSLQNGTVDVEQVHDLEESIQYYVDENQSVEFMEDETMYDDLNLEEDEGVFGMTTEADRVSSQDAQSTQEDAQENTEPRNAAPISGKPKSTSVSEPSTASARRPSNAFKSPLPALATLHTPHPSITNTSVNPAMKPAPVPARAPGEPLKYASAAAAAAASEKSTHAGISPLPPPPGGVQPAVGPTYTSTTSISQPDPKPAATPSPNITYSTPVTAPVLSAAKTAGIAPKAEATATRVSKTSISGSQLDTSEVSSALPSGPSQTSAGRAVSPVPEKTSSPNIATSIPLKQAQAQTSAHTDLEPKTRLPQLNGVSAQEREPESVYHLPPGLQDLVQSFEITKERSSDLNEPRVQKLLQASSENRPSYLDAEKPHQYRPEIKYNTPDYYPQVPFASSEDPALYTKIDTDTLFYIFYYRQNTFQQYMAAQSLKHQSWRFHKQYQTWFQRHEEPKTITEEYEQGTYRFFDYESTWYVSPCPWKLA